MTDQSHRNLAPCGKQRDTPTNNRKQTSDRSAEPLRSAPLNPRYLKSDIKYLQTATTSCAFSQYRSTKKKKKERPVITAISLPSGKIHNVLL